MATEALGTPVAARTALAIESTFAASAASAGWACSGAAQAPTASTKVAKDRDIIGDSLGAWGLDSSRPPRDRCERALMNQGPTMSGGAPAHRPPVRAFNAAQRFMTSA